MEFNALIAKINELAKKKRTIGLTAEEQKLQKELYREYLDLIKGNLKAQLDNIEFVDKKE